jgi:hypothetical protein
MATASIALSTLVLCGCPFNGLSETHLDPPPPAPAPAQLTIVDRGLPRAQVEVSYASVFAAEGGVGQHRWGAEGLPVGLGIDTSTGAVYGVPRAGGSYDVWVTVGDDAGNYTSMRRHLEVDPNLEILPPARVGDAYSHELGARVDGALVWTHTTRLPDGLVLEHATGRLHGSPTTTGDSRFTVVVLGADDERVDKRELRLFVAGRARRDAPEVDVIGGDDWTGFSTSPAGDMDQDGNDDYLVGAPGIFSDNHPGNVHLVRGGTEWGTANLSEAITAWGETAGDGAGWSMSDVGDFNGDGLPDIIIGAPFSDVSGPSAGAAYILYGPFTASAPLLQSAVRLYGEAAGDLAGWTVAGARDVNGDGLDDVIIGAPGSDRLALDAGAVYVVFGRRDFRGRIDLADADIIYEGGTPGERVGHDVAEVGSLRGDDPLDFVLTAGSAPADQDDEGGEANGAVPTAAYIVSSSYRGPTPLSDRTAVRIIRESIDAPGGFDAAGAVDLNGDGSDDLVLAGQLEERGRTVMAVTVFYGPLLGDLKLGDAAYKLTTVRASAALSVDAAGDVNGDGEADLIVGDGYGSTVPSKDGAGVAYLVLGPFGEGTEDLAEGGTPIADETHGTHVGFSVAGVGDTNGDGFDDVLVGAPAESGQGRAWLYLGGE